MSSTISPNMQLVIPTVGNQPGPQYASNVNSSLTLIDAHDHSLGKGVQITPAGININTDLPLNSNDLTEIRSLELDVQSAALDPAETNRIYDLDGELYFNDGNGNQVPITANGAVAGTPGSIANLVSPASASYVVLNTTFVFQSDVNTAANIDVGSIRMRNIVASSPALTLAPPSLASSYTITLPALPAQTNALTISAAGNMSSITYDGIGQAMTSTGADAIGASMSATGANAVAATMTSTGANAIGMDMTTAATNLQSGGKYVVVSNTNSGSQFAILRGRVDSAGTIVGGEGFSVAGIPAVGNYQINFSTPFADGPSVTVSPINPGATRNINATIESLGSGQFTVNIVDAGNSPFPAEFSFIVLGRR